MNPSLVPGLVRGEDLLEDRREELQEERRREMEERFQKIRERAAWSMFPEIAQREAEERLKKERKLRRKALMREDGKVRESKASKGVLTREQARQRRRDLKYGTVGDVGHGLVDVRGCYVDAFFKLGGTKQLVEWARKNDRNMGWFYKIVSGLLPKELTVTGKGGFNLVIERADESDPVEVIEIKNGTEQ